MRNTDTKQPNNEIGRRKRGRRNYPFETHNSSVPFSNANNCCSNANSISGYRGIGNPDLVVGVLAFDGAWVNGDGNGVSVPFSEF